MKNANEWKEIIESTNAMGYTVYSDIYDHIKQAIKLALEIDRLDNCKMEYMIVLNEQGVVKTMLGQCKLPFKVAKDEILLARINNCTVPRNLIDVGNEDTYIINILKKSEIYDSIMKKMPNGFDGLKMLHEYYSLYIALSDDYERHCINDFIDNRLNDFTKQFVNECLNRLYDKTTPDNEEKRDMEKKNAYAKKLINEQNWDEVPDILVGDIVDAAYYNDDNKIMED